MVCYNTLRVIYIYKLLRSYCFFSMRFSHCNPLRYFKRKNNMGGLKADVSSIVTTKAAARLPLGCCWAAARLLLCCCWGRTRAQSAAVGAVVRPAARIGMFTLPTPLPSTRCALSVLLHTKAGLVKVAHLRFFFVFFGGNTTYNQR